MGWSNSLLERHDGPGLERGDGNRQVIPSGNHLQTEHTDVLIRLGGLGEKTHWLTWRTAAPVAEILGKRGCGEEGGGKGASGCLRERYPKGREKWGVCWWVRLIRTGTVMSCGHQGESPGEKEQEKAKGKLLKTHRRYLVKT